jgi:hypothetical protein
MTLWFYGTCISCEEDKNIVEFSNEEDGDLYNDKCKECSKKRCKYDKKFLDSYCRVKNVVLIGEYEKMNRETVLEGKCIGGCGNDFKKTFRAIVEKGGPFCKECTEKNSSRKIKKTNMKIRGVEHPSQCEEVKEKMKKTNMDRRGVENPSQSKEVKEKMKKTNIERYGVECSLHCEEVKEKTKKTNMDRRGVEHPSQSEEVKEKMKKTNIDRRGVENPSQSEEVKEKTKKTNLERYGVEHPSQSEQVRNKAKKTNMDRRGVEHPSQSEQVRNKAKKTNMDRRGVENPSQSEEVKKKKKKTNMDRRDVENPFQCEEVKEKTKKTNMDRRGVEHPSQSEEVKEKIKKTNLERYGVENPMQNPDILHKALKSSFAYKAYTYPSGNIIDIQGYEHFALDDLLEQGYTEEQIITGTTNVPIIKYIDTKGVEHSHTPDIFIKDENRCIEVKSTWTVQKENVYLKQETAKKCLYNYELWIYDNKGNCEIV